MAEKINFAHLAHFVKNYNIRTPQDNFYGKNSGTRHKIFSAALVMKQTFLDGNGGGVKSPRSVVGCVDEGDGW